MREECPSLEREQHTQCTTGEDQRRPSPLLLLPHGRQEADGEKSPGAGVRERERDREREVRRNEEERG